MTPLENLLQQCTVKITVPGGWGTGFFVAPGLILTCAHVVRKAADLQVTVVYPAREQPLSAIVKAKADDGKTLDLALVELFEPLPDHPCVLLDEEPVAIGQILYSYGYLESYTNAAPVRPVNEGLTGDTPPLLKLQGAQIEKGISGAALLNLKTGKVCGMVKETRAAGFDLGGGAIPTRVILEQFPELRSLQQAFHGGDRRWVNLITTQPGIDFQPYREVVINHYSQQRHLYTPTDALLLLEARSVARPQKDSEQEQQPEKTVEQFPVLEGLRKYALGNQREHVLLAGRPGSGKSTTLRQLAVSLAKEGQVPVLVQLKGDLPVPDLIQAEFRRMKRRVTSEQVDEWLLDDRLVLLLDGVNEIPNDDLRRKLAQFRDDNLTVPMIFTTRDLSLGGDLGIDKRLEMKPLSQQQMREFVGKYLPEQGDRLLDQLRDRLRELTETPLLLKLLCDVFDPETDQILQNRGELFQWFDRDYRRIKKEIEYVPVSENFWEFKSEILQYLAFSMIQGEVQAADLQKPPEPWLTIHKSRAEGILETWLHERGVLDAPTKAKLWLKDLCNHDFLQDAAKPEEIEFHHQLFQEYYAAEYLLRLLPNLTDEQLKQDYLNYLKWAEPVALTLALVNDEVQAVRVVQLALKVDLMLGARLAGEVKPKFQEQTVGLLTRLMEQNNLPEWLKVELWGRTRSTFTIASLIKLFNEYDFELPDHISEMFFHTVAENYSSLDLLEALDIEDSIICSNIAEILRGFSLDQEVPDFQQLPKSQDITHNAENKFVDKNCLRPSVSELITNLKSENIWERERATSNLGEIRAEQAVPELVILLEDENHHVRQSASLALGKIASDHAIPALVQMMESPDEDPEFCQMVGLGYGLINICKVACETLANIRSELAIAALLKASKHRHYYIRREAIRALGTIGSDEIILTILESLHDVHGDVCVNAAQTLGDIGSEIAISELLIALKDGGSLLRESAAKALGKIGLEKAVPGLLAALEDEESDVVETASWALVKIGSEHGLKGILLALESPDDFVRWNAADVLGQITSIQSIPSLFKALEDDVNDVRRSAAEALGKFKGDRAAHILPNLLQLLPTESGEEAIQAIQAIQANCKFYNYKIWQAHRAAQKGDRSKSQNSDRPSTTYEVNAEVVQIVENNYGTIHGKQTP